ncbi:ABC transporter substrate-binding protein [Marivita sp. S6314]|uniref:ABC transporter substrate-binding protein n=1 Tax=Marivita sp. S6314 TaxID=2926406 RepID=UPI001FF2794E|nr:ABC transporter substrate-binding protein [Marivita sp. S6314]MCK0150497.1 ABC transporter substrate-binding protein [Marivita sp. S6314]
MRRLLTLGIFALAPCWASASDLPKVVSVNLCTDQLVMLVADPDQIVSLSALSDDPRSSSMAQDAAPYAKNNGRAEAIAITQPDIVVAGSFTDPALLGMLREIDIDIAQFPLTRRLDEIPDQLRDMGKVLQQQDRAERLAKEVEAELAQRRPVSDTAPLAAFFYPNGFALGEGTLSHDILTAGGARNLSVELGFSGNGRLSLEQVVLNQPDLLVGSPRYGGFSRSEEMTTHPALAAYPVLHSTSDWTCGTPNALRAVAQVAEQVAALRHSEKDTK